MTYRVQTSLHNRFAIISLACVAIALLIAVLALLGWALDFATFKSVLRGGTALNPVTAVSIILVAFALYLLREGNGRRARRLGQWLGVLVASVGTVVLGRYVFSWDVGLDTALFSGKLGENRMAPNSALFFLLIGEAIALSNGSTRLGKWATQFLALPALILCLSVLVGYTFKVESFYGIGIYTPMAFNTAVAFAALTVAMLVACPELMAVLISRSAGGTLARRLLPAAVVIPWALGALRLAGEQAGFYDVQFGVALMVVSTIALFVLLIWVASRQLDWADIERGRAEAELRRTSDEIRDLYDQAPCGYHSVDPNGTIIMMNQTELRWFGYAATDVVGRVRFADLVSPPSLETYRATFDQVLEQGSAAHVELELVRRDGTTFFGLLNSTSVRDSEQRFLRSRSTLFDLTERKQAEAAVRLYANVVENIPMGLLIYQLDEKGKHPVLRVRSGNPASARLLGISIDQVAGHPVAEVFPALSPDMIQRYVDIATTGGAGIFEEVQYGDRRVEERWWAVQTFPLPERSVGVAFQDVSDRKQAETEVRRLNEGLEGRIRERTEELAKSLSALQIASAIRKQAEEELRASEERQRLMIEGVKDYAILMLDPQGHVTSWNAGAERIKGYEAQEIIGRHSSRFYPREDVERGSPDKELEIARSEGRFEFEGWRVRKDGERFWANVVITAVRGGSGELLGFSKVTRDLTELKRQEEELRGSEARKAAVLAAAIDCIITMDAAGRVVEFNPAAEQTFGYRCNEVLGRDLAALIVPPRLRDGHRRGLAHYLNTGEGAVLNRRIELTAVRADGGEFPVELSITPISTDPPLFTGFLRDITVRQRQEKELNQRAAELTESNRDLAHKNAENEMFVYSVSHDLRSPLVNLQGFSKEMEKGCQQLVALLDEEIVPSAVRDRGRSVLDGKMAKSISFIQSAVMRLAGIIDAMLRLSRAGRVEYRLDTVNVAEMVKQVVEATQGTIAESRATIQVGELPPVWGDRTAIEQVFGNLVGNALTYLDPARAGIIEIGCLPVSAGVPEGFRTYYVRDNGLGIVESHQAKIFQAFQRAHPGIGKGEGLGLAIVSRIIERHRGRVWVESTAGQGSTFYVTLPVPPQEPGIG